MEERLADIELMDKLTRKSKLTEDDVKELAEKIDRNVAKKMGIL